MDSSSSLNVLQLPAEIDCTSINTSFLREAAELASAEVSTETTPKTSKRPSKTSSDRFSLRRLIRARSFDDRMYRPLASFYEGVTEGVEAQFLFRAKTMATSRRRDERTAYQRRHMIDTQVMDDGEEAT